VRDTGTKYPQDNRARCISHSGISPTPFSGQRKSRRCIVNEHVGRNLRSQLSSCQEIFQTDVARNFKDRPVQTDRSYTRNFRRRSFPSLLRTLISRESNPTCVDFYISLFLYRAQKFVKMHTQSHRSFTWENMPYEIYARCWRRRTSQMDAEGKNFSVRKRTRFSCATLDEDRIRGCRRMQRKGNWRRKRRDRKRVRKWVGIVTAAGLRGPGGQDAKRRRGEGHVARFRKEKSVILPCVTRITRVSLRKVRSVRCSIVATLMWFLFARFRVVARSSVALRLHQWHWIHTDLCKMMSSVYLHQLLREKFYVIMER